MSDITAKPQDDKGARWAARLHDALQQRKQHQVGWRANKHILLGQGYTNAYLKRGDAVNLAWAAFQTMIGQIYSRNPDPIVRERDPLLQLTARMLTSTCVEDMETMQARYCARLAMLDVFWAGLGIVMEKVNSDITSETYKYTEDGAEKEAEVPVPKNQLYTLHRVHPETFLTDPTGQMPNQSDHKWSALEFFPTIKELKEDSRFTVSEELLKGLAKIKRSPGRTDRNNYFTQARDDESDPEFAQVAIQEIWDRVNRKKIYMPTGTNKIIAEEDWAPELHYNGELRFPWSILYFNENPDEFWPIPEISMVRPQLQQYSMLFRQILDDAVNKFRRYLARGSMFGKGQLSKMTKGGPTEIITVEDQKWTGKPDFPLDSMLWPVPDPQVKQDILAVAGLVKQQIHEIIGAGDFASAGFRSTRSATEAAALSDFLRSRMTNRTENVDAFYKSLITTHVLCLQETLVEGRQVRMVDQQGNELWQKLSQETIQGKFDFSVTAGSSMPQNTELTRQENLQFFQQIIQIVVQSGGDPRALIEWIAPFYKIPQHTIDQTFKGHRQALMQVATMIKMAYFGAPPPPEQYSEAVALAINTGLSAAELAAVEQEAMKNAQAQAKTQQGLPGTNTSDQTL